MDPQFEKTPGLALPNPSTEQGGSVPHESILPRVEGAPNPGVASPAAAPQMPPSTNQQMPPPAQQSAGQQAAVTSTGSVANDDNTDSLDEEWIHKAKAIVEQTKHDPHLESVELSKVKAEYLRIRYNKHIKVAEESSK